MSPRYVPHIEICVCTYRRPAELARLVRELLILETENRFTYSIVVVDNERGEPGREILESIESPVAIRYLSEPRRGIAWARNTAVRHATGDLVALLDDDEIPPRKWLLRLLDCLDQHPEATGVLGPVRPTYERATPQWVVDGRFYERPTQITGTVLSWRQCRTGNCLLRRGVFLGPGDPFDPRFVCGEDQEFFRSRIEQGHVFIWCDEAAVEEPVPPGRWRRGFLLRRAAQRGAFSLRHGEPRARLIATSMAAFPLYVLAMLLSVPLGQTQFMRCAYKAGYHAGRLVGLSGHDIAGTEYITE